MRHGIYVLPNPDFANGGALFLPHFLTKKSSRIVFHKKKLCFIFDATKHNVMATRPWHYLSNSFLSATEESFKKALSLTNDHLAKLTANEADPDILVMKTDYLPLHDTFVTVHNQLASKEGIYSGKTKTMEELLDDLSQTHINTWRGVVFAVFPEGSNDAQAIFPNDRKPFQKGTYDKRIEAVDSLRMTLETYTTHPTLVTLAGTVGSFYIVLTGARALQQTDEGSVATLRGNLKAAHRNMCIGMYRTLGRLMAKFAATPEVINNYWDLKLVRTLEEENTFLLSGTLTPNQIVSPDVQISGRLRNTSANPGAIVFYVANSDTDPPGAGPQFSVQQGQEKEIELWELGFGTAVYVNIMNQGTMDGSWEILVIE
jgi:hypothetical protein